MVIHTTTAMHDMSTPPPSSLLPRSLERLPCVRTVSTTVKMSKRASKTVPWEQWEVSNDFGVSNVATLRLSATHVLLTNCPTLPSFSRHRFTPPANAPHLSTKTDNDSKIFHVIYRNNVVGGQLFETSLLGVGTVLRLEKDAWSMVKRQRQTPHECPPSMRLRPCMTIHTPPPPCTSNVCLIGEKPMCSVPAL